ncbi:hypothetical protein [Granulicella tundricola]|uniref:Uncharacterized protein n=1 Tax=Granulicella tundricola (strain ATCC BAA-1859 / DSM 23138 / MP5ACTX9) TaxID=1198114 RepID=E8WW37_GRATM|nr:hypothetical protein [Granulicella tundricola]ADW67343.1 hypothetical protein AciX9_0269 [Granulicella tundricola MP5ACTX9]
MVSIQQVAEALMQKDVTVAALAPRLGIVEEKGMDDYRVKPDTPTILQISLGIPEGKDASAAPSFIEYYFAVDHPTHLAAALPGCKDWRQIPGNPGASPYLYSCRFAGSTERLEVNFVATLTEDIKTPTAALQTMILQRNID